MHQIGPPRQAGPENPLHPTKKAAIMATKVYKRTESTDVFDKIIEDHDLRTAEDAPIGAGAEGTVTNEAADSTPVVEDADPVEAHDDDDKQSPAPPRRRLWPRRIAAGVACLIFVAALAGSGFFGWRYKQHEDIAKAASAAKAAAESYAVILTSIDTKNVDDNFAKVLSGATGEFKDMYSQSAAQLRQVLLDNKAMSKGIVVDSAIKSAAKTKVEVLIFVDQSISNAVTPDPRIDRSRVAMTMELVDGRWLASSVELK